LLWLNNHPCLPCFPTPGLRMLTLNPTMVMAPKLRHLPQLTPKGVWGTKSGRHQHLEQESQDWGTSIEIVGLFDIQLRCKVRVKVGHPETKVVWKIQFTQSTICLSLHSANHPGHLYYATIWTELLPKCTGQLTCPVHHFSCA